MEEAAGGITCLAVCDSPEDQEATKPTLLGAPLISRKHIHPHPVRWLAPWLGRLPGEHWRHRQSTCWPPRTPLSPKHHLSMVVHVHLDTYAKRAGSSLLPPCHQECSSAASVRQGFLTEKVQQGAGQTAFFERPLDRALADGIPSHREPSSFPTDPLHVSLWHFWCLGDRGWVAVQASPLWRGRPSGLPPIRTSSIECDCVSCRSWPWAREGMGAVSIVEAACGR